MNLPVAFDTETALIRPGLLAPPVACLSVAHEDGTELLHHTETKAWIEALLESDRLLVGANIAFDMGVIAAKWPDLMPAIFRAYEQDRVADVLIREKLQHIAIGVYRGYETADGTFRYLGYSLAEVAARRLQRTLDKDTWRLRYGELIDVPLEAWPQGAQDYARDDARTTLDAYQDQQAEGVEWLQDEFRQARAAWWMHLMSGWGMRTDPVAVAALRARLEARYDEVAEHLVACGLIRVELKRNAKAAQARLIERYDALGLAVPRTPKGKPRMGAKQLRAAQDPLLLDYGALENVDALLAAGLCYEKVTRNTKAAADLMIQVCRSKGMLIVLTDAGEKLDHADAVDARLVKLDRDTCERVGHPDLEAYAELSGLTTKLSNFVALLERGLVQPRFETLLATGRTSTSPNVQNLPRKGGVRECFVPRSGMVYASADYSGFELRTVAQVCLNLFGHSKLAEALNKGFDPHLEIARRILGISYAEALARKDEDEVDTARQVGKVANFGFPGGLGAATFVLYARKNYGVVITVEEAVDLKRYWLEAWPEFSEYFAWIGNVCEERVPRVEQFYVGRHRANVTFCQACNTLFQGLAADAAKAAGFLIAKACYVNVDSPLFGSRPVNFVHDEFIVETADNANAHDAAVELARLMRVGAEPFMPDLEVVVEPQLMRRWSKKAKPLFDDGGRLVPWEQDIAA